MTQEQLFSTAIGVYKPWYVKNIILDTEQNELRIEIDFDKGATFEFISEETGEKFEGKAYDCTKKKWRHLNFFQYKCNLEARVPRIILPDGSIRRVKTSWEGLSSGFTLLLESFVLALSKNMTVHTICEMINSYDNKVWDMLELYTKKARVQADYSKVKRVGMDETSVGQGHSDYMSLFVDLDAKKTLFVTEGKDNQTVVNFVADLKLHHGNPENVTYASCDLSPAFIKGIRENLPNAEITFDKFHVIKIINKAVDTVRKEELKNNPILKESKYVMLKNKDNFTDKQQEKYNEIHLSKLNLKTFRALHIRENFQEIYHAKTKEEFEILLKKWYWWASHSRIEPMKKAAKTIKKHWDGILNWFESRINNAILEGFNSLFKAARARARGYKKPSIIKTVIYLLTAKLDFSKINPYYPTHNIL